MSHEKSYEYDNDQHAYGADRFNNSGENRPSKSRRSAQTSRRAKSPQSVNGLHRRRRRKMSW
ncbi:hypothetical protein Mal64_20400 [Pseudobythopirellula maris]|uniref:Uncharacterized protein n=1 Tax=Pseudobythopirellula maris TaxID=2527991 RepID=A0A5C5ZN76_9BACT|nr:hypothetical protein [Pseudobythopirellula maris]TWT88556.1 hypothetical protein Mal64_20400 [Pseudobythopirellula maris]